jgi:hypothetical protein
MFPAIKGYYDKGQVFLTEDSPVSSKTNVIIMFLPEDMQPKPTNKRVWGTLKGKIEVSDDFDNPIDDMKGYM